jgi:hypothetical protein
MEYLNIHFDEEAHVYYEQLPTGRRIIPGVTTILKDMGFINYEFVKPWYADRGKKIHRACYLYVKHNLNEAKLDPRIQPYLNSFKDWLQISKAEIFGAEEIVYHPEPEFAGTCDLIIKLPGERREILVDIKSGAPDKWHSKQLAMYAMAKWRKGWMTRGLANLYLSNKKPFRWAPVTLADQIKAGHDVARLLLDYDLKQNDIWRRA